MDTAAWLWGLLFGAIGFVFFFYGSKQHALVPLICGLLLMVFPYFISDSYAIVGIGSVLMAIPYFIRL